MRQALSRTIFWKPPCLPLSGGARVPTPSSSVSRRSPATCTSPCPFDAILPMEDINDLPELVPDLCTGCGICAGVCPGLAIFIIDESRGDGTARVTIPYEFVPLPEKGEVVQAVDRAGAYVADATVTRVLSGKKSGTPQVTLSVPLDCAQKVRFFHLIKEQDVKLDAESEKEPREDQQVTAEATIICRCEGITVGDIRKLIEEGYTTVDEIKRISRAGMGPCQARTCGPLIADLITRMTGRPVEESNLQPRRRPGRFPFLFSWRRRRCSYLKVLRWLLSAAVSYGCAIAWNLAKEGSGMLFSKR